MISFAGAGCAEFVGSADDAAEEFRDTKGLIIDVRGNFGGTHQCLRLIDSYLRRADELPRVVKVVKYLKGDDGEQPSEMDQNYQPADFQGWTPAEREVISRFERTFRPEWSPPDDQFSDWRYMVLSGLGKEGLEHYDGKVVILMDYRCFSATDTFLSSLKGRQGIILMGTPSAGSSGGVAPTYLCQTMLIHLATRAYFQADGSLFDGNGVKPDVVVQPGPGFSINTADDVIDAAVRLLARR